MKRIIGVCLLVLALTLAMATPAFASPPANTPCVAHCATTMGGQHVANGAQMMEKGVSMCATITHSECSM